MTRIATGTILASLAILACSPCLAQATGEMNMAPANGRGGPGGPDPMAGPLIVLPPTKMPAPTGNFIGLSTANGRVAWNFVDLWFNQKKTEQAFDTYVARTGYVNHSMVSRDAVQTFESQKAAEARIVPPGASFDFKQVIAQGDLVVLHILARPAPDALGDEMVMFLRVRGGKIVDHWDLHSPLNADSNVFEKLDR